MAFIRQEAHDVGGLLAEARTSDVIDTHVVLVAGRLEVSVLTADVVDLSKIAQHVRGDVQILPL